VGIAPAIICCGDGSGRKFRLTDLKIGTTEDDKGEMMSNATEGADRVAGLFARGWARGATSYDFVAERAR